MNKSIKQIYVSLEMGEDYIYVLVSEFFNTRFNIIRSEKVKTEAFNGFKIADKETLIKDVKSVLETVGEKLGAKVEKLILVLPSYNFKRFPLKSTVVPDKGYVDKKDIARAISNSLKAEVETDAMVVNPVCVKYTINGISTRRIPEKEVCSELNVDIDLLCCDKQLAYEYVQVIEEAGYKVLDICLNTYAICKEASLIEESLRKNVILLDINNENTFLTLLSKGKHVSTEVIFEGLNGMINEVYNVFHIPYENISRLIKYCVKFDSQNLDDIVLAYNDDKKSQSITVKQLNDIVEKPLNNYVDKIVTMCTPILEKGETSIVVTGQGQAMNSLVEAIRDKTSVEVKAYFPETIGVRDSSLTALYGSFIVYREKALLNDLSTNCIDLLEYDKVIDQRKIDVEGESLTSKIKNLFIQYIN